MRKLLDEFLFHEGDVPGLTTDEATQWTFELSIALEPLAYLSPEYMTTGREFRAKKLGKPLPPDRITQLD